LGIEVVTMALSIMQLNIFTWNEKLAKYVKDGQPKAMM
jgi:hypothetical protein